MFTIGIDIGTTSICIVLFDTEQGKELKTIYISNESNCISEYEDYLEQDPKWILEQVIRATKELVMNEQVAAIGVTGQMHGILYVDEEGKAVSNLFTWKDRRADRVYQNNDTYAEYLTLKTGYQMYAGFGLTTHFYNQKNNLIPKKAKKFCTIADFITLGLTKEAVPKMDSTMAASIGGFCVKNRVFDLKVLKQAGLECSYIPDVVSSGTIVGYFKTCPVICACGDNQASFLAAVKNPENGIGINVGTGSQVSVYDRNYIETNKLEVRPFFNQGYLYVGASLNGGKVYEHLANFIKDICIKFAGVELEPYEWMGKLAENATSTLNVNPNFYGTRGETTIGGCIKGITKDNFYITELIQGFICGMTNELYELFQRMPDTVCKNRTVVYASGNGLRKNQNYVNRIEQCFGLPVLFSEYLEEAAVGASMCAAGAIVENEYFIK